MTTWELGINGFSWHLGADAIKREAEMAHAAMATVGLPIWSTHRAAGLPSCRVDGALASWWDRNPTSLRTPITSPGRVCTVCSGRL